MGSKVVIKVYHTSFRLFNIHVEEKEGLKEERQTQRLDTIATRLPLARETICSLAIEEAIGEIFLRELSSDC